MDDKARQWHEQNRMPKNPTSQQRIDWHLEHAKYCACRPIPAGVLSMVKDLGLPLPAQQRGKS